MGGDQPGSISSPFAMGMPFMSYSVSAAASPMKVVQSGQPGVLPGNLASYLSRFTTTPPYSRLYSTGNPLSLSPQVAPSSGAAKKVLCASLNVRMSAGTSSTLLAKLQSREGGTRTKSNLN